MTDTPTVSQPAPQPALQPATQLAPSAEAGTLLVVREPFGGFATGQHLEGEAADAVLASDHVSHVVVLRRAEPAA